MTTAVIGVREMLEEVLKNDMELGDLLSGKKVYTGKAPQGSALNYIVLGQTTETPLGAGYYHRKGHQGTEAIRCWARTKWTAQRIYARVVALLDDQRPIVSGHTVLKGVVEYVTDTEGSIENTWLVFARYRVRSLVGA